MSQVEILKWLNEHHVNTDEMSYNDINFILEIINAEISRYADDLLKLFFNI